MKNCTDGSSFQYLVDPFGLFGADIIAEIDVVYIEHYLTFSCPPTFLPSPLPTHIPIQVNNEVSYFIQSFDYGVIAAWKQMSNSTLYYEFDGDG